MPSQLTRMAQVRRWVISLLLIAFFGYLAWLGWSQAGIAMRDQVTAVLVAVISLVGAAACFVSGLRLPRGRLHGAWLFFGWGLLLVAANGARAYLTSIGRPFRLDVEEPLRLLALALFTAGLLTYPRRRRPLRPTVIAMDMGVVVVSAMMVGWMLALRPLFLLYPQDFILLSYPFVGGILTLVVLSVFVYNDSPSAPPALSWVLLALFIFSLSTLHNAFLLRRGSLGLIPWPDLGWMLGSVLLAWAALSYPALSWRSDSMHPRITRVVEFVHRFLPHASIALVGVQILVSWLLDDTFFPSSIMIVAFLALVVYARSSFVAGESQIQPYASLVNSVAEPAFVCDQEGLLRLANPALLGATGYISVSDLLGKPLALILESQASVEDMLNLALARNVDPQSTRPVGWNGEAALRRRDGSFIPVYLSLRPIQPNGDLHEQLALAGTAHDLTQQKKQQADLQRAYQEIATAREALQELNADLERKVKEKTDNLNQANQRLEDQNRKLQMLDQLKSDFVSLVSHELRSPLTNINGGIELVLSRHNTFEGSTRSTLELVQAEIARLTRFVEAILDLSALDAGRLPLYLAPTSFESIVSTLQAQMVHLPGVERIRWEAPAYLPYLIADERALTSVLYHLIDNALKYSTEGQIDVTIARDGPKARIDVADRGPGIPPEAFPMLFERFYRSHAEDSQTVYGHGLGLYIVRRLVEAMGGQVKAANRPDGGAVFTCWLRMAEEPEEAYAPENPAG